MEVTAKRTDACGRACSYQKCPKAHVRMAIREECMEENGHAYHLTCYRKMKNQPEQLELFAKVGRTYHTAAKSGVGHIIQ